LSESFYELYDDWFNGKNQITDFVNKGEVIYTPKEINQKRIDEYYIPVRDDRVDPKSEYKDIIDPAQFNQYKILDTYDYLTYSFLIPEVVRFGFIAQKESNNGESPIIVVFRGTREAEEWFNNFQFKQLEFLSGISKKINKLENRTINLGFNKMYTDYRPGIFMSVKPLNILLYFTHQAGAISSNHNMTITYCGALENIVPCCDRPSSTNQ
jgi:hypothetical protein